MFDAILEAVRAHPYVTASVGIGSFVASVVGTAVVIVRIPADYFAGDARRSLVSVASPWGRWLLRIGRNLLGLVLMLLGVVMSFPGVPGQGILTILLGVMLVDLPKKRKLERWIVSRPRVLRGIDKLRARFGRPPLEGVSDGTPTADASH